MLSRESSQAQARRQRLRRGPLSRQWLQHQCRRRHNHPQPGDQRRRRRRGHRWPRGAAAEFTTSIPWGIHGNIFERPRPHEHRCDAGARRDRAGRAPRGCGALAAGLRRATAARRARLALETSGQTLQATALVHEAYLRVVGSDPEKPWDGRNHFFAAAAEAMRRILVENASANGGSATAAGAGVSTSTSTASCRPAAEPHTTCSLSTRPSTGSPAKNLPPPTSSSSAISGGSPPSRPPRSWGSRSAPQTATGPTRCAWL